MTIVSVIAESAWIEAFRKHKSGPISLDTEQGSLDDNVLQATRKSNMAMNTLTKLHAHAGSFIEAVMMLNCG